jgi:hypothetical protein
LKFLLFLKLFHFYPFNIVFKGIPLVLVISLPP